MTLITATQYGMLCLALVVLAIGALVHEHFESR